MPAKTLSDLRENDFLEVVETLPDVNAMPRIQHLSRGQTFEIALCAENHISSIAQIVICKLDRQQDSAWMVCQSEADSGWGPFIYDAAMEFASRFGGGLVPDAYCVNRPATRIWEFYFEKRVGKDVVSSAFDVNPWNERPEIALRHRYIKANPTFLTFFQDQNRIGFPTPDASCK